MQQFGHLLWSLKTALVLVRKRRKLFNAYFLYLFVFLWLGDDVTLVLDVVGVSDGQNRVRTPGVFQPSPGDLKEMQKVRL